MTLVWDRDAWDDHVWWQTQDRKVLKRINTLIKDIERHGNEGIGKPDAESEIRIAACRYHYGRCG